jgi:hypothetical protein
MAANKLSLYNSALAAIGERSLASGEANDASRALDEAYNRGNGAIRYCLESGLWNFAVRTVQLDNDAAVTPGFGLTNAFTKPDDFVRLVQISLDEYFYTPLNDYEDERGYWYADSTPIYVRYISDDDAYGADLSLWPETFTMWVGMYLATQIAPRLKADIDMERLEKRAKRALMDAKSKDAMNEPARFAPPGSWVNARMRGTATRRDRGSRSTLTD